MLHARQYHWKSTKQKERKKIEAILYVPQEFWRGAVRAKNLCRVWVLKEFCKLYVGHGFEGTYLSKTCPNRRQVVLYVRREFWRVPVSDRSSEGSCSEIPAVLYIKWIFMLFSLSLDTVQEADLTTSRLALFPCTVQGKYLLHFWSVQLADHSQAVTVVCSEFDAVTWHWHNTSAVGLGKETSTAATVRFNVRVFFSWVDTLFPFVSFWERTTGD